MIVFTRKNRPVSPYMVAVYFVWDVDSTEY